MPSRTATRAAAPAGPPPLVRSAGIAAVGMATPSGVVHNDAISQRLGLPDGWIETRTGISERRHAGAGERLTDLAAEAARPALRRAGVAPGALDLVLVATTTPDDLLPNAAPLLADALGADAPGAVDVGAACTGFVGALTLAAGQVEAGRAEAALVVGADMMSRVVDPQDRNTSVLFGDGAGAGVGTARPADGRIGPAVLRSDGGAAELIRLPRDGWLDMAGQDTFKHAVARLTEASHEAVELAGRRLDDIDLFVYHQANGRILRAVGERLGVASDRVVDCIGSYGNTSAATIPIALCEAVAAGRLYPGAHVLVAAFGAGLTWGATVIEWGRA
ncbi:MAG: beta-ketoacyl-ACP synthase 3 [Thermoleophilaceae bacterium]